MALDGCYKCLKYVLVGFNVIVLLIGGAVLGLGVYTLVTDYGAKEVSSIIGDDLFTAGSYLLIVFGGVTLLIAFMGCCGACMESRCLLGFYFAIMLLLTICFIAICIIGFVFRGRITGQLQQETESVLINKYGKDESVTKQWDTLQRELKCCGMTGGVNSNTSWAIYQKDSTWFKEQTPKTKWVPLSCCTESATLEQCQGMVATVPVSIPSIGLSANATQSVNDSLYTKGCYDELDDFLEQNALIIGVIALVAFLIMMMGTVFSCCLCVQIGKSGYVV